jgi:hypothetical protein
MTQRYEAIVAADNTISWLDNIGQGRFMFFVHADDWTGVTAAKIHVRCNGEAEHELIDPQTGDPYAFSGNGSFESSMGEGVQYGISTADRGDSEVLKLFAVPITQF